MTSNSSNEQDAKELGGVPPVRIPPRNRSQLSLRALFFLQIQAAVIMLFVTLALSPQDTPDIDSTAISRIAMKGRTPVSLVSRTFLMVTVFASMVGIALSILFSTRWWMIVGPAVGVAVGLIAYALTLSPTNNFPRLMVASIVSSTLLILMSCWLGRSIPQEESIAG